MRRVCAHHSQFFSSTKDVQAVTKYLIKLGDSLRSSVSKNALICLAEMFNHLKKLMEADIDNFLLIALKKASDTNLFISESAAHALNSMCLSCSETKVLNGLSQHFANKSPHIRTRLA